MSEQVRNMAHELITLKRYITGTFFSVSSNDDNNPNPDPNRLSQRQTDPNRHSPHLI